MTPLTPDLAMLPQYDYTHSHHPEIGTREGLPPIFQIHVHYEPYYAPFPVTVRSDMKIGDLTTQLGYLFNTKRIFFFIFYDNRICLHSHRLQDVRGLVPSSTPLLVHWDDQEAPYFHSLYNKLNATDTLDLYWNVTSRTGNNPRALLHTAFLLLHTRVLLLRHYALLALTPLLQPFHLLSRPSTPYPTFFSPLLSCL
jgi:hypothetical protein